MNKENNLKLHQKFPEFLMKKGNKPTKKDLAFHSYGNDKYQYPYIKGSSLRMGSLECGDGWFNILCEILGGVRKLHKEIKKIYPNSKIKILIMKQKFGELAIQGVDITGMSDPLKQAVFSEVYRHQYKAARCCEVCGEEGEIRNINNYLEALCDKHFQK